MYDRENASFISFMFLEELTYFLAVQEMGLITVHTIMYQCINSLVSMSFT